MLDEAIAKLKTGHAAEAEALFLEVLEQAPHQPLALIMAARLARQRGAFSEADTLLTRAADVVGEHPQFLAERGYLALAMGHDESAVNWFERLTSAQPRFADAHFNLGQAYAKSGHSDRAVDSFERALELAIAAPEEVHAEIGSTLTAARKEREAERHFETALRLRPDYPKALYGLGVVKAAHGDFDAALENLRAALAGDPDFVECYQELADYKKFESVDDLDIQTMLDRVADDDCTDFTREKLHYALGKAFDDCGAYIDAFEHYREANDLKASRMASFDSAGHRELVDEIIEICDQDFIADDRLDGDPSDRPIFVFGMPRSGTTLLEQILASHSEVEAGGERAFFEQASRFTLAPYPQSLRSLAPDELKALAARYLEDIDQVATEHKVTNKFPANFFHVGLIAKTFPNAVLIHSSRDALDTCLSVYFQDFPQANRYANKLEDIAAFYRLYRDLVAHWEALLPERVINVAYEKLIADPRDEIERLLERCNLAFEESCLEPERRAGVVSTLSRWQVRQPLYGSSVGRWKNYEEQLQPLIDALD